MENVTIERPWGWYKVLYSGKDYLVKCLRVKAGKRISLQSHQHRDEYWTVVEGSGSIECSPEVSILRPVEIGSQISIFRGDKHRLSASEYSDIEIIEVQHGENLDESDILRYQDDFGRN